MSSDLYGSYAAMGGFIERMDTKNASSIGTVPTVDMRELWLWWWLWCDKIVYSLFVNQLIFCPQIEVFTKDFAL